MYGYAALFCLLTTKARNVGLYNLLPFWVDASFQDAVKTFLKASVEHQSSVAYLKIKMLPCFPFADNV